MLIKNINAQLKMLKTQRSYKVDINSIEIVSLNDTFKSIYNESIKYHDIGIDYDLQEKKHLILIFTTSFVLITIFIILVSIIK